MIGVGGFFLYLRFNSKKKEKTEAKYIEPALTATEAWSYYLCQFNFINSFVLHASGERVISVCLFVLLVKMDIIIKKEKYLCVKKFVDSYLSFEISWIINGGKENKLR